jgi:hypothetical protein
MRSVGWHVLLLLSQQRALLCQHGSTTDGLLLAAWCFDVTYSDVTGLAASNQFTFVRTHCIPVLVHVTAQAQGWCFASAIHKHKHVTSTWQAWKQTVGLQQLKEGLFLRCG